MPTPNKPVRPDQSSLEAFCACLTQHAYGRTNAKTARQLCRLLGLSTDGDRTLRALANAATDAGQLICTGNDGYWLPADPSEAEETIGRLQSQGVQMLERARQLRTLVERHFTPIQPNLL